MGPTSACLAIPLPARSGQGVHLVHGRLEDHTELALQTGQRVAWWDREGEALQDPGQEEEELHLCQGLSQTHPDSSTERQVAGRWDDQTCAFTVQEPTCRGGTRDSESTHTSKTTSLAVRVQLMKATPVLVFRELSCCQLILGPHVKNGSVLHFLCRKKKGPQFLCIRIK